MGYGFACLCWQHVDPEGGHTILWLLETLTVSQIVGNYVRNWLK
jgi:hypothetical protein